MMECRAHHLMCTLAFQGYGYSPHFVENYKKLADQLVNHPETIVKVVGHLDDICSACPHQTQQGQCNEQAKVLQLDDRHRQVLGISIGDQLSWGEAVERIRERMSLEKFQYACQGCSWQASGLCQRALFAE